MRAASPARSTGRSARSGTRSRTACSISRARCGVRVPLLILHPGNAYPPLHHGRTGALRLARSRCSCSPSSWLFATISWVGWDVRRPERGTASPCRASDRQRARARPSGNANWRRNGTVARSDWRSAGKPTGDADASIADVADDDRRPGVVEEPGRRPSLHEIRNKFHTGLGTRLDEGVDQAAANPALAIYKLQSSAYKYSWILIPAVDTVRRAAVPVAAAVHVVRSRDLRDLFDRIHDDIIDRP